MKAKTFYITTAIPYVNAAPHIGQALEFVQADAYYRFKTHIQGVQGLLLSGGDENALKNVQAAERAGKNVQEFVDENSVRFEQLGRAYNIHIDVFQKGSDVARHFPSSQKLWTLCENAGDIYKKEYTGLYCVGCETFYTPDELDERGECYEHPGRRLEQVSESNYFFRLSAYQERVTKLIEDNVLQIVPETRRNEVLSFLKNNPLQDISISRSNERAKNWGVPVPGDDTQRIYVWFDALNIYQSGVGFGWDDAMYQSHWPADVHVIGKGIIRFHAVYWPAFLMSAGLATPKKLFVHGYITVNGQKMSKTLGNVIDPFVLVERYGVDAVRYFLLREISAYGDGDFSYERFSEVYNADLANGIGNLTARITRLAEGMQAPAYEISTDEEYVNTFEEFRFNEVVEIVSSRVRNLDKYINDHEPWKITDPQTKEDVMNKALIDLAAIAHHLIPIIPDTAHTIIDSISGVVSRPSALFPRLKVE